MPAILLTHSGRKANRAMVPEARIRQVGSASHSPDGDFVLYWMIANRRTRSNYSLDRAIEWSRKLKKPLLVLEALRAGYRWNSDRIHAFAIQGMIDNARGFAKAPVTYYPYLEPRDGDGKGLLAALARRSCVVISDDFPCFFLPRMIEAAARQIPVRFELVDSNGLMPMRNTERVFARPVDFRRYLQSRLAPWLELRPVNHPLQRLELPSPAPVDEEFRRKWPPAVLEDFEESLGGLSAFPINHSIPPVAERGGSVAAHRRLKRFVSDSMLGRYSEARNQPEQDVASGLSPWLHFGHISAHEIFAAVTSWKPWDPAQVSGKATGSKEGWWGASPEVESFLDELVTWRELGFNLCALRDDYDQYASLPEWARKTLDDHRHDEREFTYSLDQFANGETHDELWNAAQGQLREEGRIHNYLRMLWGKKILEWTASPEQALDVMVELNNGFALDGRNPNSWSGIFWILGRYDRPWFPERAVFGTIRYMSSTNTARKVRVKNYIRRYAGPAPGSLF